MKIGAGDPRAADKIEGQLERERGKLSGAPTPTGGWEEEPPDVVEAVTQPRNRGDLTPAAAEAMRRRTHAKFTQQLENAWKFRISHL